MTPAKARALASVITRQIDVIRYVRASAEKPWKAIHKVADAHYDEMKRAVLDSFYTGKRAIKKGLLKKALTEKDHAKAEEALSPALEAMDKALRSKLPDIYRKMVEAGGKVGAANLKKALKKTIRASASSSAVKLDFEFDPEYPDVEKWIKEHTGELISDMTATTRNDLRDIITSAFEEGRSIDEITGDIESIVHDDTRAEMIARTETLDAANEGQTQAWDQAVDDGLLTGAEKVVWIVTPDDRLCPICAPMEGVERAMDDAFDVDGDEIDAPPAHPNCRCTIGLSL